MAEVFSVACNHCGAPLEVEAATRFVTCTYCGARLEVRRQGNALYTTVLESIDQRTQQIAQDVNHIRRQNEIERLDREWMMRREQLLVRDKHGATHEPSVAGGLIAAILAAVFGVVWIGITLSAGAPGFVPLFGVIFILVGVIGGITSMGKASEYRHAEQEYQRQRDRLLRADDAVSPRP